MPHFHVEGPDFRCSIGIATGDVIVGDAPVRALAAAGIWARTNTSMLAAKWQELTS